MKMFYLFWMKTVNLGEETRILAIPLTEFTRYCACLVSKLAKFHPGSVKIAGIVEP
jgi:hypothetical protein